MDCVTYTNRKGTPYYLCQGRTKTGKIRYYFAREPREDAVTAIPAGYVIEESVNGIVSLSKDRPSPIRPEELAVVAEAIRQHPQARNYRVGTKHRYIIVYASSMAETLQHSDEFSALFLGSRSKQEIEASLERLAQYRPEMRFRLHDAETRAFIAERWCYRGSVDGWITLHDAGPIADLARRLIPTLGTEEFFELW